MIKIAKYFALVSLTLLAAFVSAEATTGKSKLPNVILIYADDVGFGDLSCYGATKVKTPHLDKLAANGMRFTNAHSTAATCTPSRYSILTGDYAWRKKGTGILPGDANLIIPTNKITLGKMFQQAGYKTAVIGKWHLGLGAKEKLDWNTEIGPGPNDVGFDYSFIFPATGDRVPTVYVRNRNVVGLDSSDPIEVNYSEKIGTEYTGKENPELLKMKASPDHGHDGTIVNGIGRIGWMTGGQRARWTDESLALDFTQELEEFVERSAANPFFVYFATNDIHVPRMPGTRFKGSSGLGYRGDALLQLDYTVGRVMTKLEQLEIDDDTIVIFSSDNGPVLDDGYDDKAVELSSGHVPTAPYRGGKYSMLEGGTRLPFILHWPARVKPGVSDALISQVDFLASFAALTKQEIPELSSLDSKNILPALTGEDTVGRESLIVHGKTFALIKDQWKYILGSDGLALMQRVNIESGLLKTPQLFDLKSDPQERNNLVTQKPEVAVEMEKELSAIRNRQLSR